MIKYLVESVCPCDKHKDNKPLPQILILYLNEVDAEQEVGANIIKLVEEKFGPFGRVTIDALAVGAYGQALARSFEAVREVANSGYFEEVMREVLNDMEKEQEEEIRNAELSSEIKM